MKKLFQEHIKMRIPIPMEIERKLQSDGCPEYVIARR